MPPSAAAGSAATASPASKSEDGNGSGGFTDDAVSALGAALAGVSVGEANNSVVSSNGGFGGGRHGLPGVDWGSASNTVANALGNREGFSVFNGQNSLLDGNIGVPPGAATNNSFPEQLPSLMATKGSALKQRLESSVPAPTTPSQHGSRVESFLSRSSSQQVGGDDLLKAKPNDVQYPSVSGGLDSNGVGSGPSRSTKESNPYPPGFAASQAHVPRNSSPSASVVGTSASSRSTSPLPSRGYSNLAPPTVIQPAGGEFTDRGGFAGQRNMSTNSLRSMDGNQQNQRNYGLQPQQAPADNNQFLYAGAKLPSNPHGPPIIQPVPVQQAQPQIGEAVQQQPQAQQVLYMAVQTQDGRQVLQPVQMVQLAGQAPAVVMPTSSGQGLISLGGAQIQGSHHGQAQPVVLMPTVQASGMPVDNGIPIKQGNRRHNGLNYQGPRRGGRQSHYDSSAQHNGLSGHPDHRSGNASYAYVEDRQPKHFGPSPRGGSNPGSRRTTPNSSQRSSPRGSPTPNDFIASLYASPQRPPLNDLLGHVRRLSRDQVGCRLLQQALDEEGPMAATLILNEGLSFWGEAMVDPFGNYLFQKIAEKASFDERVVLVRSVCARLVNASLNLHGTRSVQKVVELCAADEAAAAASGRRPAETAGDILTRSLAPAAARLCIDSHGNHVIQRILLKLPYQQSQFVFEAVAASVGDVARHRHGCCVIQRCLDSPPSEARSHLVHRIVEKALELMQDAYGNYVVQYVLDVCGDEDVHAVCEAVVGKVCLLAIQKFSSNVMEKCLERCTDRVREHYLNELSDQDKIRELMMDPFGNYVIQRALAVATHSQAIRLVEAMKPHLLSSPPGATGSNSGGIRNTAGGRRIMAKICRRFPNFTLMNDGSAEHHVYQPVRQTGHRNQHRHQRQMMSPRHGHHGHQQYQVAHQRHGNVAGSVPPYPVQMGNNRMMYPHSM